MSEVLSGAGQGAATGASFGPMGAVVGAGIGALSGFMSGRRRKKAERQERRRQARIRQIASPAHLAETMTALAPMFKQIVASGLGPQFSAMVADSLAKHGMTGTGVGEAMRTGAASAPAIFATQAAGAEAGNVVKRELAAEGMNGPEPAPSQNPILDALMGGARGFLAGGGGTPRPAQGGAPVNYGSAGIMTGQPTPNLTPSDSFVPSVFSR